MAVNSEICNWREVLGWAKQPARKDIINVIEEMGLAILTQSTGRHSRTIWIGLDLGKRVPGDPTPYARKLEKALQNLIPGSTVEIPDELYRIPLPSERPWVERQQELNRSYHTKKKQILIARIPIQRAAIGVDRNLVLNKLKQLDFLEDVTVRRKTGGIDVSVWLEEEYLVLVGTEVIDDIEVEDKVWPQDKIIAVETILDSLGVEYKHGKTWDQYRNYFIPQKIS